MAKKHARKLSEQQIVDMFAAYQEKQSIRYVSQKCHIHHSTVSKYCKSEHWDERLIEIRLKAQRQTDYSAEERLRTNAALLRTAKQAYRARLLEKCKCPNCGNEVPVPGLIFKAADIDKLIRLERYLFGENGFNGDEPKRIKFAIEPPSRE